MYFYRCLLVCGLAMCLGGQEPAAKPAKSKADEEQEKRAEMIRKFMGQPPAPDKEKVEHGRGIFTANCAFCHGSSATGGEGGPDLVRSVLVLHDNDGDKVGPVIL